MGLIDFLFGEKRLIDPETAEITNSDIVETIIHSLKVYPEKFSSLWFNGMTQDRSIRSDNKKVSIMIDTGEIIAPNYLKVSASQTREIKRLILPIVKRDQEIVRKDLFKDF